MESDEEERRVDICMYARRGSCSSLCLGETLETPAYLYDSELGTVSSVHPILLHFGQFFIDNPNKSNRGVNFECEREMKSKTQKVKND